MLWVFVGLRGFLGIVWGFVGALEFVPCCETPKILGSEGLRDGQPPRIDNISQEFQTPFLLEACSAFFSLTIAVFFSVLH